MAEFIRAQIFGTTFEITSRLDNTPLAARKGDGGWRGKKDEAKNKRKDPVWTDECGIVLIDTRIYNRLGWVRSGWSGMFFEISLLSC